VIVDSGVSVGGKVGDAAAPEHPVSKMLANKSKDTFFIVTSFNWCLALAKCLAHGKLDKLLTHRFGLILLPPKTNFCQGDKKTQPYL
jgi:hypothetical protein